MRGPDSNSAARPVTVGLQLRNFKERVAAAKPVIA